MPCFQTLEKSVRIEGIGIHSGAPVALRLSPREECGIVFRRGDLPGKPMIFASPQRIGSTLHATRLEENGASVSTPEHLLAALWSYGITHCDVEINGPEIPILDGSAKIWCELIERAGIETLAGARPHYALRAPVLVHHENGCVLGLPHKSLRVTADVEFGVAYLPTQVAACEISAQAFRDELAPARTFALEKWLEPLRAQNLIRGGNADNALVLGENAPSSPLRFETELARHKALDAVGDVSLLFAQNGGVLQAHIVAIRAGHELHRRWMEEVLRADALVRSD